MDDERIWSFEAELWKGGADVYRERIEEDCLMVLPQPPFVMRGRDAIEAVTRTPRWDEVALFDRSVSRPQEGLIVIAYRAVARRGGESYAAYCSSTYRRLGHEQWRVVQHQQSPVAAAA